MRTLSIRRKLNAGLAGLLLGVSCSLSAAEFSASFKGTDINEFINVVGKNLNKTIIVEPSVRGQVNVRSYDLLNDEQYYQFFLNVLEVYGFAVVEMKSGVLKVIKSKDAKTSAIPVVDSRNPGEGDQMVTRVVPVRNVSVRELAPLLRQLNDNAGGGNVVHYDPSNVIMITGRAAVVNRLVEIVRRVDKAGDQEVDIIHLKYASAGEMVRILEALSKKRPNQGSVPTILQPKVVADDRTNAIIVSGDPKARARLKQLVAKLDSELETFGNTRVFYLKYAKAKDVVEVLTGVSESIQAEQQGGGKQTAQSRKKELSIEAHEDTNALVITAQPDVMQTLEQVINQLDIRRAQVLVEAIIVELTEGDAINLGVQWATAAGGGVQFNDGSVVPIGEIAAGIRDAEGEVTEIYDKDSGLRTQRNETKGDISTLANAIGRINGMAWGVVTGDFGAVIQAVSTDSHSNILATPSLTTLDNEEASFIVGEEVPTITGSSAGSNNDNPFQTIERTEVGIKLKVTPQINEGDAVQLTIEQEVSQIQGATAVDVTFAKREVKTTVLADSGQTIVLSGLLNDQVVESESKVPLLGDIPILGHLFRSTKSTKRKTNLMVFIRPTIIRDSRTMAGLSTRKYSLMRAAQLQRAEQGINLMPGTDVPVLPEWGQNPEISEALLEYLDEQKQADLNKAVDSRKRREQPKQEAADGAN